MKHLLVTVMAVLFLLSACTAGTGGQGGAADTVENTASYAAVLKIGDSIYQSVGNENNGTYPIGEKVGEVQERLPAEVMPEAHLTSNYLEEGTAVFVVEEESDVFLAKKQDGEGYEIFEKTD